MMSCQIQTETWLYYGLSDLYFAFDTDDIVFDYHAAFFSIMGLEKHLKAHLIFSRKHEFIGLNENQARSKAIRIAKKYSHGFEEMAQEVEGNIAGGSLSRILEMEHDGYRGRALLKSMCDAYMEVRYPSAQGVYLSFPTSHKGIYFNPLQSTALHGFIRQVCASIVLSLEPEIDMRRLLDNVERECAHRGSFKRFKNIFLPGKWNDTL